MYNIGLDFKHIASLKFKKLLLKTLQAVAISLSFYILAFYLQLDASCYDVCSGQAAVITPRQVISGLGSRRVKVIAAAKHHTVVATEGGEVFTWGSNRGKL